MKCYLCGDDLHDPVDKDHVPMKQLYSKELRKRHGPNLLTIPVHASCNKSFQSDEDYFVQTLIPFAQESYSGRSFFKETLVKIGKNKRVGLVCKVLNEFERKPSGLTLPIGKVVKRFEGERLNRVIFKLVRGLHFHSFQEVVSEKTNVNIEIFPPDKKPPDSFYQIIDGVESMGDYPAVFDYKLRRFPDFHGLNFYAFLLWDRVIVTASFLHPECGCQECRELRNDGKCFTK